MKYFQIPLYHCAVLVLSTQEYNKKFPTNWKDGALAQAYLFGGDVYITFDKNKLTPGLIAHECLHAAMMIFEVKEIDVCPSKDEHLAYLLEFIYNNVYNIMYKKKGKK